MPQSFPDGNISCFNLVELLRWRAIHQSRRRAYTFLVHNESVEVHLTYGELDCRARAIGAWLQSQEAMGERVLLLYPAGLEYIAAFLGCLYAGAIAVPSYPPRLNRHDPRLQAIITDAQASLALTTKHILSGLERLLAQIPGLSHLRWTASDNLADVLAEEWHDPRVTDQTLAFLQYTSGSTAAPKGVMVTHGNILQNERMIQQAFGQSENSSVVGWLPMYHDMGLIGNVLQPLYGGAYCVLMSPQDFLQRPFRWLKAISRHQGRTSGGPNFAYDLCVRKIAPEERALLDLSSWEVAFSGAEPVHPQTLERFVAAFEPCGFRREAFYPCYGLAEATLFVSGGLKSAPPVFCSVQGSALEQNRVVATAAKDEGSRMLIGCGRTWPDQEIAIVHPDACTPCAADQVGEIWVSGPHVAQGYWNRPEESKHTFRAYLAGPGKGPFLRTEDLGFLRDGELFVTGRIKDLVIIRGRNHYPQDIEWTVEQSHPALQPGGGAAFSVESNGEERLVVVQELKRDHLHAEVEPVMQAIRQAVAEEHELQVHALLLIKPGSLPKTSSGKVQRHACRSRFLEGSLKAVGCNTWDDTVSESASNRSNHEALRAALAAFKPEERPRFLEEYLRQEAAQLLRVDVSRIDPRQALSSLGLDSLLVVELQHRLETGLGVVVSMADLLQSPSMALLAVRLAEEWARPEKQFPGPIVRVARDEGLALSFAQQRLWLLEQLQPGNPAYNLPAVMRLHGSLNVAALVRSVNEVVKRHESLRTNFTRVDGRPVQTIASSMRITVPAIDLQGLPGQAQEADLQQWIAEEIRLSFNLVRGSLLRAILFRLDEEEHVFLLVIHHIVCDGWSMGVFARELEALYQAFSVGRFCPLPELPVQYADYAAWQHHWMKSISETQIAYWKRKLASDPLPLDLPFERRRPAIRTFRGSRQSATISKALAEALKALSQQEKCTLFMTLLAAFKILLQRYSGQDDVVVGSPVAGRHRAETGKLIGFFLNTLVLRTDLSGNPTFRELLHRVRETTLGAYANQDVPFEKLLDVLRPRRDLSRTPLFQVFFNMLNLPGEKCELPGLRSEILVPLEVWSLFDLTIYLEERKDGIKLDLVYNADLFGQAQMEEMLEQFRYVLAQLVEKPEERIARYSLVTATATRLLPNPAAALDADWKGAVHTLFSRQARLAPDRWAVADQRETWTYGELEARSNQLARCLRASGIQSQDVVAIYGHRSASLVWAVMGVLKSGAAFVILDPLYPAERLIACLRAAQPQAWLQVEAAGELPKVLDAFVAGLPCRCRLKLPPRSTAAAHALLRDHSSDDPGIAVGPDDLALVAFTSGSTGVPKGILGRHGPLSHFLPWQQARFDLRGSDRYSLLAGLAHDPLQREIFTSLCLGATLCIPDPEQIGTPVRLVEWMRREKISVAHLTPAMIQVLNQTAAGEAGSVLSIPSLRYAFIVGDVLTGQDISKFRNVAPGVTCVCHYGSTETQRAVGHLVLDSKRELFSETIPLGKGIQDVQLLVLNASQQLAGIGELGEIHVRSPHLARGYLGDEALTRERFISNPLGAAAGDRLYRTGDLGRYLPDGNVAFRGRSDHQIKIRGFRIEPGEIETFLLQYPGVREAVVTACDDRPDDSSALQPSQRRTDKRLVAYVVSDPHRPPASNALRRFLEERLPHYMAPSAFVMMEALPLTPNHKVDRRALPVPDLHRPDLEQAFVAPRTPEEKLLVGIWVEVLGVEQVGVHDNFFDLGGNSVQAIRVHSRLLQAFEKDLPVLKLFEHPTVHLLAEYIRRQRDHYPALQKSADRAAMRKTLRQQRMQLPLQKR